MIAGILLCLALWLTYHVGWVAAHKMIAAECERNGAFFVGGKTFKCIEIKQEAE